MSVKEGLRRRLYKKYGKRCRYCGIRERDFIEIWGYFYKRRGSRLEIEHKDNNKRDYDMDNCVLACAICNNAKSNKFSYEEFTRVGNVIRQIWQERNTKQRQ